MKNKDHAVSLESYKDHSKYQHNGASTIIYQFFVDISISSENN